MKLAVGVLLVELSRISLQGEYCGRQGPLKRHHWSRRKEACMFVMSVFMNVYVMCTCVHRGTDLYVRVCVCVCVRLIDPSLPVGVGEGPRRQPLIRRQLMGPNGPVSKG